MQIVIDIPENLFNRINKANSISDIEGIDIVNSINCIRNGTLLPKGHGRLKDADKISDRLEQLRDDWNYYGSDLEYGMHTGYDYSLGEVMNAPTIIEADDVKE